MGLKRLLEDRAVIGKQIVALQQKAAADKRSFTKEEADQFDKMCADFDAFEPQIDQALKDKERKKRAEAVETAMRTTDGAAEERAAALASFGDTPRPRGGDGAATEEQRTLAFNCWARAQMGVGFDDNDQAREAIQKSGIRPNAGVLRFKLTPTQPYNGLRNAVRDCPRDAQHARKTFREARALSSISGTAGGYLIPPETLIREFELNMLWYGGMRQVADQIRTSTGERMSWPTADDTTNKGVLLGESTKGATVSDPTFGKVYWDAYKFSSSGAGGNGAILVPYELLQDAQFDVAALLGEMMGIRLGRATNTYFTTGTGAAQPKGLITCAAQGVSAASASAITYAEMLTLEHSVDRAYRYMPGCGWMFHDLVFKAIRQLTDTNGRPIWLPNITADIGEPAPGRISNYPYTINNDMDSTLASLKKVMAFGDLSRYKIRTVGEVRMYRLEERYREFDQDGFVAFLREDGNLLDAGTTPVKYYQMHS